jgi:hypothetical protein
VTVPVLAGLEASGTPAAWRAAGFAVHDGIVTIGRVPVSVGAEGRGISAWTLSGTEPVSAVDGLPTRVVAAAPAPEPRDHPNTATRIDHLVVWSPHSDRTVAAFGAIGLVPRRVREDARPGFRQTFFRTGEVIVELVAAAHEDDAAPDAPARFFGIACTVADLDACAARLGDALGPVKDAVQPGRRIATLRGRELGLDVAIAFMDDEPEAST